MHNEREATECMQNKKHKNYVFKYFHSVSQKDSEMKDDSYNLLIETIKFATGF